jgi:hypothetical protein
MTRILLTASAAAVIAGATPGASAPALSAPPCGAAAGRTLAPPAYVAVRHLEGRIERSGRHAWMDVRTTLERGRFTYEVLQEGGSSQIREKALYPALKREQEIVHKGGAVQMPALLASYDCADPEADDGEFVRVAVRPREPDRHLINGTLLWEPRSGAVVSLIGQLSKNPSFWVSDVQMRWDYGRVAGTVLPTAVRARAKVKFVGPSTFDMTYRYISVDGRPVATPSTLAGGQGRQ